MTKYPVTKVETLTTPRGKTVRVAWANGSPWFLGRDLLESYDDVCPMKVDAAVRHVEKVNKRMIKRLVPEGQKKSEYFFDPDAAKFLSADREEHADMRDWIDEMSGWKKFFGGKAKPSENINADNTLDDIPTISGVGMTQIFTHEEFGQVRTIEHNQDTWFIAMDVCRALGINDTHKAVERLDDDEKGRSSIPTLGGCQEMLIVNEPGLYELVIGSRKPEARAFKRWIKHEVLPSIRKHGGYVSNVDMFVETIAGDADDNLKNVLRTSFLTLQQKQKEVAKLQAANAELDTTNKALYADNSSWSDRTIITTLVPAIATRRCMTINNVYAELYREAKKRYHFDLYTRRNNYKGNEPKPIIAFASEDELHKLAIMVATVGYRCNLDLHRLLNPVNAEYAISIAETN